MGLASEEELDTAATFSAAAAFEDSSSFGSFSCFYASSSTFSSSSALSAASSSFDAIAATTTTSSSSSSRKKERSWYLARAKEYLEAQRTAKPSLLSVLRQRQHQLQQAIPLWVADTEEAMFNN